MISADQALQIVLENAAPLGVERIPIVEAASRVLAEDISSPRDIPGFDNSAMDGYAVRAADLARASEASPVKLTVIETVGAGKMPTRRISAGEAVRTMTGAPIAEGADAIVPVEWTRGGGTVVEFLAAPEKGASIRPRGEDLRLGEPVISAGKTLKPADLGMLASVNRAMVEVIRRPRVAIVATGDELVDVDERAAAAQVVNSSSYSLAGAIREAGAEAVILKIARDDAREIRNRLAEAMTFDVVLSTGGVSVGQFDHVTGALDELGMRQRFHGVAQKPGRPLKFGTVGYRPIFGLPGNPVSTLVCFYLYARPAILKMSGMRRVGLPRIEARCAVDIKLAKDLTEFVRVRLERGADGWLATPTGSQQSGILSSLSRADGLLVGPSSETLLKAGVKATVMLLGPYADGGADAADELFEGRRHSH